MPKNKKQTNNPPPNPGSFLLLIGLGLLKLDRCLWDGSYKFTKVLVRMSVTQEGYYVKYEAVESDAVMADFPRSEGWRLDIRLEYGGGTPPPSLHAHLPPALSNPRKLMKSGQRWQVLQSVNPCTLLSIGDPFPPTSQHFGQVSLWSQNTSFHQVYALLAFNQQCSSSQTHTGETCALSNVAQGSSLLELGRKPLR